jgi:hypothetical protein
VTYRFLDFQLDTAQYRLTRRGEPVHVEPLVFDLIALFAANPGVVIDRDRMIEVVWQGRFISDATLSSALILRAAEFGERIHHRQRCRSGRDVAGDRRTRLLCNDTRCLEDLALRERHSGVVLRELDESGRDACVCDALCEFSPQEVGDLLDRSAVYPVGHERLTIDSGDQHRGKLRPVSDILHDVRSPTDTFWREFDERPDA